MGDAVRKSVSTSAVLNEVGVCVGASVGESECWVGILVGSREGVRVSVTIEVGASVGVFVVSKRTNPAAASHCVIVSSILILINVIDSSVRN